MKNNIIYILTKSGWYPERNIPISNNINKKYHLSDNIANFIHQYADLTITFSNPKNNKFTSNLIINPVIADKEISNIILKSYEKHINSKLIPIAVIHEYDMIICMSELGSFYGGNDDWLIQLGNTFEDALDNLINGKNLNAELVDLLEED